MGHRVANETADVVTETKTVTNYDPKNTYNSGSYHAFHHGREDVFPVNHSTVEKCKTRRHQKHESGCNDNPGDVGTAVFASIGKISDWLYKHGYDCNSNEY